MTAGDVTGDRPGPDWDAAVRGLRREELVAGPGVVAFFAGLVLLTGGFGLWDGAAGWLAAGVFVAVGGAVAVTVALVRGRARRAADHRSQAALRLHADPGPDVASRVDRHARYLVQIRWTGWLILFLPLGQLVNGQWDRSPVQAAVGAALVLGISVGYVFWWDRRVDEARRWVADPPGAPRPVTPESAVERWARPRRVIVVAVVLVLTGIAGGLLASLV